MSDTSTQQQVETAGEQQESKQEQKTLTQAEVDQIVKERVQRERAKFADYDDLKAKAAGARTLEEQIADLTEKHAASEARALRSDIAAKHGISATDRDLFLTGSDEETLTAQAKRLTERESERKAHGNVAPNEGKTQKNDSGDAETRAFLNQLVGNN